MSRQYPCLCSLCRPSLLFSSVFVFSPHLWGYPWPAPSVFWTSVSELPKRACFLIPRLGVFASGSFFKLVKCNSCSNRSDDVKRIVGVLVWSEVDAGELWKGGQRLHAASRDAARRQNYFTNRKILHQRSCHQMGNEVLRWFNIETNCKQFKQKSCLDFSWF